MLKASLGVITVVAGLAGSAPAWAWTSPGCANLPEYERALGALQGMTSACDMSIETANRIVAAQGNRPGGLFGALLSDPPPPVAEAVPISGYSQSPAPRLYHRREAVVR